MSEFEPLDWDTAIIFINALRRYGMDGEDFKMAIRDAQDFMPKIVRLFKLRREGEAVNELKLSPRALKGLIRRNIYTIPQLVETTAEELLEVRNFGQASLAEVREALARRKLGLRGEQGSTQ